MNSSEKDTLLRDCGRVCEAAQFGVWEYNQEEDSIIGNTVFWHLLGYDDVPSWRLNDYLEQMHSQDQNIVKMYWQRTKNSHEKNGVTFRYKHPSGSMRWFKKTLLPHHKPPHSGLRGVLIDVTNEQEAIHKLNRQSTRLKGFVDNMPGAAYVALNDDAYTMLYISDAIVKLTGYSSEDFLNRKVIYNDLIHSDDRKKVRDVMTNIVKHQVRLNVEYRIITKDGKTKWVFEQGAPNFDGNDDTLSIAGVIIDISKRKLLDEALLIERQKLRQLVKSTADIIFEVDMDRTFVSVYGKGLDKFGLTPEDFENKTVTDVFGKDGLPRDQYYQDALDGNNVTYNWTYDTGKKLLHYHSSIAPMRDAEGNIIGAVGIAREITEEREQALKHEYLSHHDPLTDLYNRHYLYEVIEREIHRASRYDEDITMIVIDIDDFKGINDKYGHMAGDATLKALADCFKRAVRKSDLVFRTGGEEFLLVLPKTNAASAMKLAERIKENIKTLKLADYDDVITCSFGVGERNKDEIFESWWKKTDDAMRLAKDQGKNRVVSA